MACLPCYTTFLNNAPSAVRENLHFALNEMLTLPLDSLQAELDQYGVFLAEVDGKLTASLNSIILSAGSNFDISTAMEDQGVVPGDCPQIDSALFQLQLYKSLLEKSFRDPYIKSMNTMQNQIASLSSMIASVNVMLSTAGGLIC